MALEAMVRKQTVLVSDDAVYFGSDVQAERGEERVIHTVQTLTAEQLERLKRLVPYYHHVMFGMYEQHHDESAEQ